MGGTSHPVKRADRIKGPIRSKMDINGGGVQRLMSKQGLNSKKVGAIFVEMGAESVAERMAGQLMLQAEFAFFGRDKLADGIRNDMLVGMVPFGEEPAGRFSKSEPVVRKDLQCQGRQNGVPVRPSLRMADMDPHGGPADILIAQGTDFADPKPGGIHEREDRFMLEVGKGLDKIPGIFLGRDIRKVSIKPAHRELGRIPGFMQNIEGKETELGDTVVDRAVREGTFLLKPADIIPEILPGDIFRLLVKDCLEVIQIRADVSRIRFYGVGGKATEGDHLPENV